MKNLRIKKKCWKNWRYELSSVSWDSNLETGKFISSYFGRTPNQNFNEIRDFVKENVIEKKQNNITFNTHFEKKLLDFFEVDIDVVRIERKKYRSKRFFSWWKPIWHFRRKKLFAVTVLLREKKFEPSKKSTTWRFENCSLTQQKMHYSSKY